jgi:hypothetical protein
MAPGWLLDRYGFGRSGEAHAATLSVTATSNSLAIACHLSPFLSTTDHSRMHGQYQRRVFNQIAGKCLFVP